MKSEKEATPFESSEALASFLASTPLLADSWKICSAANTTAPGSFVMEQCGDIGYVAFSGVQEIDGSEPSCGTMVELGGGGGGRYCTEEGLFSALKCDGREEEEVVMVDAGFLSLFLSFYSRPDFHQQMQAVLEECKSVIITGHSLGATTASLTALWLLSSQQSLSSSTSILCITFGSPLLGNKALAHVILQERWGGNFCHIVSKHDIMPRLFFASPAPRIPQLQMLLRFWRSALTSSCSEQLISEMHEQNFNEFFSFVLSHAQLAAQSEEGTLCSRSFWPLGSYLFCSEEGAICLDGATSVIKMMHLMLVMGSPATCIEDHLKYADHVGLLSSQFLKKRIVNKDDLSESSYEASVSFSLQSSGLTPQDDVFGPAKDCLEMARQMGRAPNLNNAHLAIRLSKVRPWLARLEWYKALCDESEDQLGYYDTFKKMSARRESKVYLFLVHLGLFWDKVIRKVERNEVSHDFHRRSKWVNASQYYMLLAEPLEIAYYYRTNMHLEKGHYIENGRERRFRILEEWWKQRSSGGECNDNRSRYASLTQDSCFWARVEKAKDWLESARNTGASYRLALLLEDLSDFEMYAAELIKKKQVSIDVVAKNSSYSTWVENWRELKLRLGQLLPSSSI